MHGLKFSRFYLALWHCSPIGNIADTKPEDELRRFAPQLVFWFCVLVHLAAQSAALLGLRFMGLGK